MVEGKYVSYIICCAVSYDYKETNNCVFLIADTSSSYNYLLLTSLFVCEYHEILTRFAQQPLTTILHHHGVKEGDQGVYLIFICWASGHQWGTSFIKKVFCYPLLIPTCYYWDLGPSPENFNQISNNDQSVWEWFQKNIEPHSGGWREFSCIPSLVLLFWRWRWQSNRGLGRGLFWPRPRLGYDTV